MPPLRESDNSSPSPPRGGSAAARPAEPHERAAPASATSLFDRQFRRVFEERFASLFRYVDRWCGDQALASDVAQETFIRLYRRGQLPDDLGAWLVSVANNLLRDERRRVARRERLLGRFAGGAEAQRAEATIEAELHAEDRRRVVRRALDVLSARDRSLLLLRHEGCSYRDLAKALHIRESSVGALLARARERFRVAMGERNDALD